MAHPWGIRPNPYVTSILTSILTQECVHKPFLRSPKMTSKSGYSSLLPCSKLRVRSGQPLSGQSAPSLILCACNSLDLRLTLCGSDLHSSLPCFSLKGNFTKVRSLPDL